MKILIVIGEPGSGKTTLMKKFMASVSDQWEFDGSSFSLVPFHKYNDTVVLGKYEEGEVFGGTDRMSMAVQPKAIEFLGATTAHNVVFEGDRLSNQSFIEHCIDNHDVSIIYLEVSQAERERRYILRGSNQSEQFLKGRETKYSRLMGNFSIRSVLSTYTHMEESDTDEIVTAMKEFLCL